MLCLYCRSGNTKVIASEQISFVRKRRYRCDNCGKRFNTVERIIKPKDWRMNENEQD